MWLALPVVIALGAGVGYLAAQVSAPSSGPPAAASHAGHGSGREEPADSGHGHSVAEAGTAAHNAGTAHPDSVVRPRATVLISFGVVNAGILVAALALRHRDRRSPRGQVAAPRTA